MIFSTESANRRTSRAKSHEAAEGAGTGRRRDLHRPRQVSSSATATSASVGTGRTAANRGIVGSCGSDS
jgi:hypothetical protein